MYIYIYYIRSFKLYTDIVILHMSTPITAPEFVKYNKSCIIPRTFGLWISLRTYKYYTHWTKIFWIYKIELENKWFKKFVLPNVLIYSILYTSYGHNNRAYFWCIYFFYHSEYSIDSTVGCTDVQSQCREDVFSVSWVPYGLCVYGGYSVNMSLFYNRLQLTCWHVRGVSKYNIILL